MRCGVWRWRAAPFLSVSLWLLGACRAAPSPVPTAAAAEHHRLLGLGRPPDKRFIYTVQSDGVYVTARAADPDGRPVFSRRRIKVASISPALPASDRRVVDRDGDLVPAPGSPAALRGDVGRVLKVLVSDPARAAQLDAGPQSKEEFLALDDQTLVAYASAWLRYRGLDEGAALSPAERDVMLSSLAFQLVAGDGFSGLLAMREDDLPAMREALRRLALDRHAQVIENARQLALAGQQAEAHELDAAWKQLGDDPVPRLAAYIRAHADEFDWKSMAR
jgi:hypothetical protein